MSFEIIDNTKPKSPRYVRVPKPTFRTERDRQKYWDIQMQRWLEGYSGLNGMHYFYLQEGWIKDNDGTPIRPKWREGDEDVFYQIKYSFDRRHDAFVVKRREFGLTCIGAGCLPFYFIHTNPGCTVGMTSCDLDRITKMFNDKTLPFFENLDEDITLKGARGTKYKISDTNQKKNLRLPILKDDEDKGEHWVWSEVFCPETIKDPKAFSSARMLYAFIDEVALHVKRQQMLDSLYPTLEKQKVRIGNLLMGGTVEKGITQENLNAIRDIVKVAKEHPEASKTDIIFIPAWRGMSIYTDEFGNIHNIPGTETGHDNEKFATEIIMRERERLDKLEDKAKLMAEIKNYPLTLDEVLESTGKSALPPEIRNKVEIRFRQVRKQDEGIIPTFRYKLDYDDKGELTAFPDSNGNHYILRPPNKSLSLSMRLPYIAGNDPIPYGDADLDDGSSDCMVIKNRVDQIYDAIYIERNMDADYTFREKQKLQTLYGGAPSMLEMNRGEVVFTKYKDNECLHLLAKKPVNIGIKYETSRKYGWYKNKTGARANELLFKFLLAHIDRQHIPLIFQQLEVFLLQNTDVVDAMLGCEIFDEELRKMTEKSSRMSGMPGQPEYVRVLQRDANGNVYWEMVEVDYG